MEQRQVQVGDRFGRLTITQLRPCIATCDCGKLITRFSPSNVLKCRVQSCGCLKREQIEARRQTENERWSSIECLTPEAKVEFRRYRVTCRRCGNVCERNHHSVVRKQKVGCASCLRRHRTREARAERRAGTYGL